MTTVNRRKFLKAAGAGGVAAAATTIAAPAIAQTNPEVKWRMQAELAEVARHTLWWCRIDR